MAELPVDLVEDIFLRLDDVADLVRASAACAAFRRVVSDSRFLRRFRSLHCPPVLGLLSRRSCASAGFHFNPAVPPRRTTQAARSVARAAGGLSSAGCLPADPTEHCLHIHDARDGRILLSPGEDTSICLSSFSYLVVYDPLHRKHVQVPPIPTDIVACTCSLQRASRCECQFDPFFVPATDDEKDDSSFRVMCTVFSTSTGDMEYDFVLEAFVYSSVTAKWCRVASVSDADYYELLYDHDSSMERHYAQGCFYWVCSYSDKEMLVLDMNEMKFSAVRLPPGTKHKPKAVVKAAAAQDRIGLLVLSRDHTNNEHKQLDLYTKAFGAGDTANDCWQWRHDAVIPLLDSYQWCFGGAADQGYALLLGIPRDEYLGWRSNNFFEEGRPKTNAHYFTVDLQTLLVEQLCEVEFENEPYDYLFVTATSFPPAFMYASFPPPFALPSV